MPHIVLHAISRDIESYPLPCLYCQLSSEEDDFTTTAEEEEEKDVLQEIRFIPADEKDLFPLFEALSYASSINPDPASSDDGEDDGGDGAYTGCFDSQGWIGSCMNEEEQEEEEDLPLSEQQTKRLKHWDSLLAASDTSNADSAIHESNEVDGKYDDAEDNNNGM